MRLVRMSDTRRTHGGAKITLCNCGQVLCGQVLRFNGQDLALLLEERRTCASRSGRVLTAGPGYLSPLCAYALGLITQEEILAFDQ